MPDSAGSRSQEFDQRVEKLLVQACDGDRNALGDALNQLRPTLWALANELLESDLKQKVAPSDLVQETCVDAFTGFELAQVKELASLKAWLVTLLVYNLIDWRRKFKKTKKRDLTRERPLYDHESQLCLLHATLHGEQSPESEAIAAEARGLLEQALGKLPPAYRQIITWRNRKRLTWAKIARIVDRSEDAVRMLWKRAMARLKRELRRPQ